MAAPAYGAGVQSLDTIATTAQIWKEGTRRDLEKLVRAEVW
jgi:hypothetical protein